MNSTKSRQTDIHGHRHKRAHVWRLEKKRKNQAERRGGRENEYMRLYELIRHQQIQTHKILEITAKTQHQAIKEQNRRNYRSVIPCTDEKKNRIWQCITRCTRIWYWNDNESVMQMDPVVQFYATCWFCISKTQMCHCVWHFLNACNQPS